MYNIAVAPFVGAWIEIIKKDDLDKFVLSLPSWERGLKSDEYELSDVNGNVAPFVGAWIEIYVPEYEPSGVMCRSLRGSVD